MNYFNCCRYVSIASPNFYINATDLLFTTTRKFTLRTMHINLTTDFRNLNLYNVDKTNLFSCVSIAFPNFYINATDLLFNTTRNFTLHTMHINLTTDFRNLNLYNVDKTKIPLLLFPLLCLIYLVSKFATIKYKIDDPIRRNLIPRNKNKLKVKRCLLLTSLIVIFVFKTCIMFHQNTSLYSKQIDLLCDDEFFTELSIRQMNQYTWNSITNNYNMLALSKTKLRNYSLFFRFILLLSGDINLHPGPPLGCSVCGGNVNKRSLQCEACFIRTHKKCTEAIGLGTNYRCKDCLMTPEDLNLNFPDINNDLNVHNINNNNNNNTGDFSHNLKNPDTWKKFQQRGLHFIHLNINSLLPKIHELRHIAVETNAAVIGISESKLDDSVLNAEIEIEGYSLTRSDRNRHGGGVVCYIRENINYNLHTNFSQEFENIVLDLLLPNTKPILIGIFYNPPNKTGFLENLNTAINDFKSFNEQEVFLLGDLNINLINKKGEYALNGKGKKELILKQYQELCTAQGLHQLITEPTRISENSSTLLDHVLTNAIEKTSQSGIIDIGLSDHQLIFCTRKVIRNKFAKHKMMKIRSMRGYTKDKFLEELDKTGFLDYSQFEDVHEAYTHFSDKLILVIDEIAPIKEVRIKNDNQEWFDGEVLEKIRIRDKLFNKYKKSKLHVDKELYHNARNAAQSLILKKKKQYTQDALQENIGKPKELWRTLQGLGLKTTSKSPQNVCLETQDGISFNSKSNANIFKNFFSKLAENLIEKLPKAKNLFGVKSVEAYYKNFNLQDKCFSFVPVNKVYIEKLLSEINISKAAGIDSISGRFLKDGASKLAIPVMQLFNLSIALSTVPDNCKIAKLKPLFKKGSKTDPKNYRPISLLPLVSKIFERAAHDQLQEFLEENKILYKYQSGFRKNHSTNTCLSHICNKILEGFDKGMVTGMILIDLQKAFDTIDHKILLEKMKFFGFADTTIAWFRSYLTNRLFLVNVGNTFSDPSKLSCGVPQGSILGPLLFLLYVNDMPQAVQSDLFLYADDTCLVSSNKNTTLVEEQLNKDFNSLCDWFEDNKLSIHFGEDKTKSILFSKRRKKEKIQINRADTPITQHTTVTYLGCLLDEDLSGESMAIKVLGKINGRLKFLYRKNEFLTAPLRRLLCNALVQPHFDFASSAWYPNLSKKLTNKLRVAQNKCIRFCLHLGRRRHIGFTEFEQINWLPIELRYQQSVCSLVHNFFRNKSPAYMSDIFYQKENKIQTRNSVLQLIKPSSKTNGQKGLAFLAPSIWNELPSDMKLVPSLNAFKHQLKKRLLDSLNSNEQNIYL